MSLADRSSPRRPIHHDIRMGRGTGGKTGGPRDHDRGRFGDTATLFVWAKTHRCMTDN